MSMACGFNPWLSKTSCSFKSPDCLGGLGGAAWRSLIQATCTYVYLKDYNKHIVHINSKPQKSYSKASKMLELEAMMNFSSLVHLLFGRDLFFQVLWLYDRFRGNLPLVDCRTKTLIPNKDIWMCRERNEEILEK